MFRRFLVLLCFLIPIPGNAATCFWVGGAGNFSDVTHWSVASGGGGSTCLGAGGVPYTGSDSATIDAASGAGTVTINVASNTTGTLTTGAMGMTLVDAGNIQTWGAVSITGTGVRVYNLTASEWDLTGTGTVWDATTTTSLTNTSMPTLIKMTSTTSPSFNGGSLTYNDIMFTGSGAVASINSASNTNFRDLTAAVGSGSISIGTGNMQFRDANINAATCPTAVGIKTFTRTVTILPVATSCVLGGTVTLTGTSSVSLNGMTGNTSLWIVNTGGAGPTIDQLSTTGSFTLTQGGVTFTGSLTTGAFTQTMGTVTLNTVGFSTSYASSNTNVRTLIVNAPWHLTGTGTIFNEAFDTNLLVTCGPNGYFAIDNTSSSSKSMTFAGPEIAKCIKYTSGTVPGSGSGTLILGSGMVFP